MVEKMNKLFKVTKHKWKDINGIIRYDIDFTGLNFSHSAVGLTKEECEMRYTFLSNIIESLNENLKDLVNTKTSIKDINDNN